MGRGINGTPGAAIVVPFTNRTPGAPCGPRPPSLFHWRDFKDWVVGMINRFTVDLTTKADKVSDGNTGNLVGIGDNGSLVDSGLRASGLQPLLIFDTTPTAGSLNPVTSGGIKQAIEVATPGDYERVKAQISRNTDGIAVIEGKIPSQASVQNQLADKAFVNSSIATNTATFRGTYNLVADLGLATSATHEQVAAAIKAKLAALSITPEHNDYCFIQVQKSDAEPTVVRIDRYKCSVEDGVSSWGYEWSLNNSSFTADQWTAINSGITNALVTKLGALPTASELATSLLAKYEKPNTGIPKTDLSAGVQASLDKADSALQNTGNQTISNGSLWVKEGNVNIGNDGPEYDVRFLAMNGVTRLSMVGGRLWYGRPDQGDPDASWWWPGFGQIEKQLALISDMYAAVQQIAPAWVSGTTYSETAKVSYNGVVYARKTIGSITSSTNPATDTTNWEAKKVSESFLGNTGDQTITGESSDHPFFKIGFDATWPWLEFGCSDGTRRVYSPLSSGTLALLSDMYAAVQQIAPDFTAKAYTPNELCTYNGVVYRCKNAYTATASSSKPSSDTTHWEVKKVSELFLPLTGGTVAGTIRFRDGNLREEYDLYRKWYLASLLGILQLTSTDNHTILFPVASGTLALLQNLAPDFSTSATYALNKLCVYDGKLYRCTTAVTTAGGWTGSTNWTAATVQDILTLLAPLASPAFTGTPTAPDIDANSPDGQVVNKKYVDEHSGQSDVGFSVVDGKLCVTFETT